MLKIGALNLKTNIILAPLAGISDSAFRLICRSFGAQFTFVEMINARAVSYKNKQTKKMLETAPGDKPIGIQLLGSETTYLLKAMDIIKKYDFDLLDFNAACPVKKVCRRKEGAALMQEPKKLETILKSLRPHWEKPLSIKIRSGWDQAHKNAVEISKIAQDAGIDAIFIHGRDRKQFYSGSVDYSIIAEVKKNVSIPVIASGDIWSGDHAIKMFNETGCDGILVARGALGNPWIFGEIEASLKTTPAFARPQTKEVISILLKHLRLSIEEHGEKNGVALMRKFVGWYLKGKRFIRPIRNKVNSLKTEKEFIEALRPAFDNAI